MDCPYSIYNPHNARGSLSERRAGRMRMTRTSVKVVFWAMLFALPGVAQGADTPTSTIGAVDAGSVVDVDVTAGLFKDPLPFDVPFYIRGTRDDTITSVSAKVLQFPQPVNCLEQEALFTA